MRPNFSELIKEELVKRFEKVVIEEVRQHELAVEQTCKEIKSLQEQIESIRKEQKDLCGEVTKYFDDTRSLFNEEVTGIKDSFRGQQKYLIQEHKRMDSLIEKFTRTIDELVNVRCIEDLKSDMDRAFKGMSISVQEGFDCSNRQNHELHQISNLEVQRSQEVLNQKIHKIEMECAKLSKELDTYKIDYEGLMKEIQVHKKTVFIQEKMIENIYQRLDKLDKEGTK